MPEPVVRRMDNIITINDINYKYYLDISCLACYIEDPKALTIKLIFRYYWWRDGSPTLYFANKQDYQQAVDEIALAYFFTGTSDQEEITKEWAIAPFDASSYLFTFGRDGYLHLTSGAI